MGGLRRVAYHALRGETQGEVPQQYQTVRCVHGTAWSSDQGIDTSQPGKSDWTLGDELEQNARLLRALQRLDGVALT